MKNAEIPYTEWEKDELLDALEALCDFAEACEKVSKYGVSVDPLEARVKIIQITGELNRRYELDEAEMMREYERSV